jgi:hypothetical protein
MGMKEVYELLDKSEEGKKLIDDVKAEIEKAKAVESKARKAEADKKALESKVAELLAAQEKDDDGDEEPAPAPKKKSEGDSAAGKKMDAAEKRMKAILDKLEASEKARQEIEAKAKVDRLRSDFGDKANLRNLTVGDANGIVTDELEIEARSLKILLKEAEA